MPETISASIQEIQAAVNEPEMVTYCCLLHRPGIYAWMVEVEHTKFKPDTDANDDFHACIVTWPEDMGLKYILLIFHQSEQRYAESLLWKNGLRKVKEGFTGVVISHKGMEQFPIKGPRVYFLENNPGHNVVYTNDPVKMRAAFEHERAQVEHFFTDHKKWFEDPANQPAIEAYWKKHPEGRNR